MNQINVPIVFSTDHNFVMQTGVCILSLLMNAVDEFYDIYVLIAKDVTNEDKRKLQATVKQYPAKLNFVSMDDTFANAYEIRNISTAAYYRLLIPWLLPHYDKVIYADVDMIFQIGLHEVYNMDIGDNYVAGVRVLAPFVSKDIRNNAVSLGLDVNAYINSGFLVINSKRQREDNLKSVYLSHAAKKYIYQDQDIINIVCKDRINPLPLKYNVTYRLYELYLNTRMDFFDYYDEEEVVRALDNGVIHYVGVNKPWSAFCFRFDVWWYYYRVSLFYDIDYYLGISVNILKPVHTMKDVLKIIVNYIRNC